MCINIVRETLYLIARQMPDYKSYIVFEKEWRGIQLNKNCNYF